MTKRLITALTVLSISLGAMAVPAKPGVYKNLTLGDGKVVRVMLVGDEHGHYWRGDDGRAYTVKGDVGEPVDEDAMARSANARRAEANRRYSRRLAQRAMNGESPKYMGKRRCLIVLVNFADVKFKPEHDLALFERIANEEGFSEGKFRGSVADYFKDQSRGLFELQFDVVGPVELTRPMSYYGENGDDGVDKRLAAMPYEAMNMVKGMQLDWKSYDWDENSQVDQVYLIYAGRSEADTGIADYLWPHTSRLSFDTDTAPVEVGEGLVVDTYACGSELRVDNEIDGIGTMCHEFSHCLGYPDFYPTNDACAPSMGSWDVMDRGCFNGEGYCPPGYTSYERWKAGWQEPIVLEDEDVSVDNMRSLQSGGESYIIYNKANRNEFFLLENRQLDGWDASLFSAGLLMIHVDYDPAAFANSTLNNDIDHQRSIVVPADGAYQSFDYWGRTYYTDDGIRADPFPSKHVTSFNKRFKTYDRMARNAARLYHANADGNHWIDSSVELITQHTDGTISFRFVAHDQGADPAAVDGLAHAGSIFNVGEVAEISPAGWLQTLLQRQHDGLTGHPEALSYPYNSCLWAGEISSPVESYGENWWRYEQTAYYTEGLLKLGYELGDSAMMAKAMEGIEYTLAHPDEDGVLGNRTLLGITWPMSVFFRVLQAKYEHDGDERIPRALERHYLNFTPDDLTGGIVGGRNIMSIEGILWTYSKTGNPRLLQLAEDAWGMQDKFALDATAIESDEPFYMHAVTFAEMLKLPLLLYEYTGNERYRELAEKAIGRVEQESMLPDGVPTSAEFLLGNDVGTSHETCVVTDYSWTLSHYLQVLGQAEWADKLELAVYNAGMGAITKDFRSLQYFSSVNQFIATGTSNHNIYKHGSTWMAYRPTHETECCSGNVNRMLPNFVGRMWMTDSDGGAVATLYGPSQATLHTPNGDVTIACDTDYPFSEMLMFRVSGTEGASIPLTLRIPAWCTSASIYVNGELVDVAMRAGTFVKLPKAVKAGDMIVMHLPMKVERKTLEGQGVYFQRGPLLFAYPIPQLMTEDTEEYANMHGKKPENPDFKCWNITPVGDFNYAYADNGQPLYASEMSGKSWSTIFPFDLENHVVEIPIPVKQIEWDLVDQRYTPALPEQGHLQVLTDDTQYIRLVPYGCTELRLTVFPDANAEPLPEPEQPDYTRPDNAPDCVEPLDGCYYAYFEEPRFCWDEPIYCKARTADGTCSSASPMNPPAAIDLHSNQDGDMCEIVGKTDRGRYVWRWTGPALSTPAPTEVVFTNHDLLTDIMPFENGGYYNYQHLIFRAAEPTTDGIVPASPPALYDWRGSHVGMWYTLDGRRLTGQPTAKGIYIYKGKRCEVRAKR